METALLILSLFFFYYPLAMINDTARRYDNMCKTGNADHYNVFNNIGPAYATSVRYNLKYGNHNHPITYSIVFVLALICAMVMPLVIYFKLLDWRWYYIVLLHIGVFSISQIVVLFLQPGMTIYTIKQMRVRAFISLILGFISYFLLTNYLI